MSTLGVKPGWPVLTVDWRDGVDTLCDHCCKLKKPISGMIPYQGYESVKMREACQMCHVVKGCVDALRPKHVTHSRWNAEDRTVFFAESDGLVIHLHQRHGRPRLYYTFRCHISSGDVGSCGNSFIQQDIAPHAGHVRSLDFLRKNLVTCLNTHPECEQRIAKDKIILPKRLLFLRHDKSLAILVSSLHLTHGVRYAALSHCWGQTKTLRTTRSNLPQHSSTIPYKDLPADFLDAVRLCAIMYVDYLWIDALCIVQDDPKEWAIESEGMHAIYSSAIFTIAAASSSSSARGFLNTRRFDSTTRVEIRLRRPHPHLPCVMHARHSEPDNWSIMSPLDRRAWTFQEQIMSRRIMRLTAYQSKWQCAREEIWETGFKSSTAERFNACTPYRIDLRQLAHQDEDHIWQEYIRLMTEYSRREITKPDDMLPAISGIVSYFARITNWTYLAGLWSHRLHLGLCWSRLTSGDGLAISSKQSCCPSWSWASLMAPSNFSWGSLNGVIIYGSNTQTAIWGGTDCHSEVEFLDRECFPITANKFGAVQPWAYLRLRARLVHVQVVCRRITSTERKVGDFGGQLFYTIVPLIPDGSEYGVEFKADCRLRTTTVTIFGESSANIRRSTIDDGEEDDELCRGIVGPAVCMLLYSSNRRDGSIVAEALVLGREPFSACSYRRLGLAQWSRWHPRSDDDRAVNLHKSWKHLFEAVEPEVIDLY